ncbi:MAG: 3-oxoacyl-[acyl-carrier-protein] synthase III C-terminal domain-containing protein [Pseudomonadota bacterium]
MSDKIKIESLGVYLPENTLSMEELMRSCHRRPCWDLERITGIRERRVAVGEYAVDLAVKAAKRALSMSRYTAADLDVVVCTSISKHHAPAEFTFEPATAVLVRRAIGARRALVFDVVNACAGLLNGIWVLQGLIRAGVVRCGMVVSGEQNMPLAETAARQIRHSFDGQIAALTLGDCGAAVIIDRSDDERYGFHWLDLVTGAKHDQYCYSKPSPHGPGGMLITRARGFQKKGSEHFPFYLKQALDATGWTFDDVQHAIPHQVSVRAIKQGIKAVNRFMGCEMPDVFPCNAEKYANTTTTSHFLVLHDYILQNKMQPGDNILLISGASGIVITHATLTLDDLPTRYRACFGAETETVTAAPRVVEVTRPQPQAPINHRRCRIESLGMSPLRRGWPAWSSLRHALVAGHACLERSHYHRADVRVLINCGVYRDDHVCEPAIAAYIAHGLNLNIEFQGRRTTAFDLLNGGCGMLNAIQVVDALLRSGEVQVGMVIASEINSDRRPDPSYSYPPSGAAVLLDCAPRDGVGFGSFAFDTDDQQADRYRSIVSLKEKRGRLSLQRQSGLDELYLAGLSRAVAAALARDGLRPEQIDVVVPPQISKQFIGGLPAAIGIGADRIVDLTGQLPDTLTTSTLLVLQRELGSARCMPGKKALLLACGSGVTVGAATYHF